MKDRYFFFFWVFSVLFGECGAITARRTPRNGPGEGTQGRFVSGKSGAGKPRVCLHFSELRRADAGAECDFSSAVAFSVPVFAVFHFLRFPLFHPASRQRGRNNSRP
jgi:hypothetical protein